MYGCSPERTYSSWWNDEDCQQKVYALFPIKWTDSILEASVMNTQSSTHECVITLLEFRFQGTLLALSVLESSSMGNEVSIPIPWMDICNLPSGSLCGNGITGKFLNQKWWPIARCRKDETYVTISFSPRILGQLCNASELYSWEEGFESQSWHWLHPLCFLGFLLSHSR